MMKFRKNKDNDAPSILTKRMGVEKIVFAIAFIVFVLYSTLMLCPLLYLFISSFKGLFEYNDIIMGGSPFALPEKWQFKNYLEAITLSVPNTYGENVYFHQMFFNSIWYCTFVVGGNTLMSCFTGYIMAKYDFKAKELIFSLAIFSMTIPIVGSSASALKLAHDLNLWNTPFLTLFSSLSGFGFYFMVMYGFFKNVSWTYAEAVFLDGGNDATAFFRVMLPQAKMAVVTIAIVSFINAWNLYEDPLIFLPDYPTMAAGLYKLQLSATRTGNMPYYFAGLIISITPVIIIYALFSDVIMKNFSVGGIKG